MSCRQSSGESRGQKRGHPDSFEGAAGALQHEEVDLNDGGLQAWGYMPGHVHWKVDAVGGIEEHTSLGLTRA